MFGAGLGPVGYGHAPGFTPRRLVTRYDGAWWRADLLVTQVAGAVSDWGDSGGIADGTARTASWVTSKPTWAATDANFGNRPSIAFGVNDVLRTGAWSSTIGEPFTVWAVGKITAAAVQYIFDASAVGQRHSLLYNNDSTFRAYSTGFSSGYADGSNGLVFCIAYTFNGAVNARVWMRSDVGMVDGGSASAGNPTGVTLGNYAGGGAGGITLAEVAVFKAALTSREVSQLMGYAEAWYGIRTMLRDARDVGAMHVYHRADVVTLAGRGVGTWPDQSGNGDAARDLQQPTDASRPLYVAASADLGDKPAVYCENNGGGTSWMSSTGWSAATTVPYTVWHVGKWDMGIAVNPYLYDSAPLPNVNQAGAHGVIPIRFYAGGADWIVGDNSGVTHCMAHVNNGANSESAYDSNTWNLGITYNAGIDPGPNVQSGLTLGCYQGAVGNILYNWHGPIAEYGIFNRILARWERRQLVSYARRRYLYTPT